MLMLIRAFGDNRVGFGAGVALKDLALLALVKN
jgi:hypothetical protein